MPGLERGQTVLVWKLFLEQTLVPPMQPPVAQEEVEQEGTGIS